MGSHLLVRGGAVHREPLHWGFVFLGWMALGVFGVVLPLLLNVHRLLGKEGVALLTE